MSPWRYRNTWFLFALYRLGRSDQEALRISGKNTKVVLDLCCVWNCISAVTYSYSDGVDIINGTRVSLATVDKFSLRVTKITQNLPFRFLYSRIYLPAACFPLIYHQHYFKSMLLQVFHLEVLFQHPFYMLFFFDVFLFLKLNTLK